MEKVHRILHGFFTDTLTLAPLAKGPLTKETKGVEHFGRFDTGAATSTPARQRADVVFYACDRCTSKGLSVNTFGAIVSKGFMLQTVETGPKRPSPLARRCEAHEFEEINVREQMRQLSWGSTRVAQVTKFRVFYESLAYLLCRRSCSLQYCSFQYPCPSHTSAPSSASHLQFENYQQTEITFAQGFESILMPH